MFTYYHVVLYAIATKYQIYIDIVLFFTRIDLILIFQSGPQILPAWARDSCWRIMRVERMPRCKGRHRRQAVASGCGRRTTGAQRLRVERTANRASMDIRCRRSGQPCVRGDWSPERVGCLGREEYR